MHLLYSNLADDTFRLKLRLNTNHFLKSTGKDSQALRARNLMNHSPLTRRGRSAETASRTNYTTETHVRPSSLPYHQAKSKRQSETYLVDSALRRDDMFDGLPKYDWRSMTQVRVDRMPIQYG